MTGQLAPTRVPLAADLEARVEVVDGAIDIRLWRRESHQTAAAFQRIDAGLRLPMHLASSVAEAITRIAKRAAQDRLWEPPASDGSAA